MSWARARIPEGDLEDVDGDDDRSRPHDRHHNDDLSQLREIPAARKARAGFDGNWDRTSAKAQAE